ncbi:MAG: hypothetical protein JWN26_565 [Candidatus Saccharibacteria bacterium]|nr:hypothetical protein [Candidatus Saccharibacteria bacterium]
MSLLQYLKLQPLEPNDDGTSSSPLDDYAQDESISLDDDLDEQALDEAWNNIVKDIEQDPEWFRFNDDDKE